MQNLLSPVSRNTNSEGKFLRKLAVAKFIIYSTSPVKKITGVFDASVIHQDSPYRIWNMFGPYSGISEENSFNILEAVRLHMQLKSEIWLSSRNPRSFDYFLEFTPPQSTVISTPTKIFATREKELYSR